MNGDREFEKQLQLVKQLGLRAVRQIEINLAVLTADKEYNLAGNFFYIKDAPDSEVYIEVKINSSGASPISWTKQTGFLHPFNRLYITSPAGQAGTMKILIAAEAPRLFDIVDHRSAISESIDGVLAELRGGTVAGTDGPEKNIGLAQSAVLDANADRKAFNLQAKLGNTGNIYLGYTTAVTTTRWFAELEPGRAIMKDDYRGPVFAISDTADQKLGWGEW